MKNSFATIVNRLSVLNFFQLSNRDFLSTKCVNLDNEVRALYPIVNTTSVASPDPFNFDLQDPDSFHVTDPGSKKNYKIHKNNNLIFFF